MIWDQLPNSTMHLSDMGWLPKESKFFLRHKNSISLFDFLSSPEQVKLILYIALSAGMLLILGYFPKLSIIILYLVILSIRNKNVLITDGSYGIMTIFLFLLFFSNSCLKLKSQFRITKFEIWPLKLLQIQVCIIYFFSGLSKLSNQDWLDGNALTIVLLNPLHAKFNYLWISQFPSLMLINKFITWILIAWELSFSFLVFIPRFRYITLIIGVFFHLSLILFFNIGWFGELMILAYVIFIPNNVLKKYLSMLRLKN